MRTAPVFALAFAACLGGPVGRPRLDAARFAPRPEWTPAAYALGEATAARGRLTRGEMIEDIAFLQHVLDQAWASDPALTRASWNGLRESFRDLPLDDHDRGSLCAALAEQARNSTLAVTLDGAPCRTDRQGLVEELQAIPPQRNYAWKVDDDDRSKVGLLTIARFVDPADPGWAGLDQVLAAIAAQDVVVVDLQDAVGDDPRIALAIASVLGVDAMRPEYAIQPVALDNAFTAVVRRNHAARFPAAAPPRDRAQWLPLWKADDYQRIGREQAKVERTKPLGKATVLWGERCQSACQLVVQLARHTPRFETIGSAAVVNHLNGDEPGLVRLPHSGIEVTFPTVSYGPYANRLLSSASAGFARQALAGAHLDAYTRATAIAWRDQPLPSCATLAIDPEAARRKQRHCSAARSPDDPAGAIVSLKLDAARTREFLASCPSTNVHTVLQHPVKLTTIVTVGTTVGMLGRIASAPFVESVSGDCPSSKREPKHDETR